jgi:hypothetical protein
VTPDQLRALVELAAHPRTPVEEARSAAVLACREIQRSWRLVEFSLPIPLEGVDWPKASHSDGSVVCRRCRRRIRLGRWVMTTLDGRQFCGSCDVGVTL